MESQNSPRYIAEIARGLRRSQTSAEEVLWRCLRNRSLAGAKFRRQHPIGRYIADFYCYESALVVEIQGSVHSLSDQIEYDEIRQEVIEQQGLKILTFDNQRVLDDLERVLSEIQEALTPSPSSSGRGANEAIAEIGVGTKKEG